MEDSSIPKVFLNAKFLTNFSDFTYIIYGVQSLIILPLLIVILPVVYKKIRRQFPLKVNCWFCNNNTTVPYELYNGWNCPHCKQYNGFCKDGDYNKIIPEQYNFKLNESNFNTLRTSIESKNTASYTNGFCKLCNINQQLKIQQLTLFVPINEEKYFEEIEQYREKLEKAYKLCSKCERNLQETLKKQEYSLLQNRLNSYKQSILVQKPENLFKFKGDNFLLFLRKYRAVALKSLFTVFGLLLFLALIIHFETENHFLTFSLPEFVILKPLLPILKILIHCTEQIYSWRKELSFAGFICSFLLQSKNQITLLGWGLLHISSWSSFTELQVVMSLICFFLNFQMTQTKIIHLNKISLTKKSDFQPIKRVFPNICNSLSEESKSTTKMTSPLLRSESFRSLNEDIDVIENKKGKQKSKKFTDSGDSSKKLRHKEDEIDSFSNEGNDRSEVVAKKQSQNISFNNKSSVFSPETDKNSGELNGPISEVYNTLNSLQLGGDSKKSRKPPNFLFANHNYSEVKSSSSIIKPAKFIKNLNSSSWTESNECNSRSSTPSSGYSSQKPEKLEHNRYDFAKSVTPISINSFNRHSPNNCYDYCDGNHGFYNSINCFPPGFIPFQQFPGSMGHTTIYTCTRPTNFAFPFSPWQGFPSQKHSPNSPQFSDASDCDHLFQESSKKFEQNRRWFKFKTILYYFSIFFNVLTIMGIVYFTSAGIVSIDWMIPKFHFFL